MIPSTGEARGDHTDTVARSDDGRINEAMSVLVVAVVVPVMSALDRPERQPDVTMNAVEMMFVCPHAVVVSNCVMHGAHLGSP